MSFNTELYPLREDLNILTRIVFTEFLILFAHLNDVTMCENVDLSDNSIFNNCFISGNNHYY